MTARNTMDELSIDSMSNDKIYKLPSTQRKRAHFTIDWRQLTYYHRERRPILGACRRQSKSSDGGGDCGSGSGRRTRKKLILNSLDGCFRSGQLSAILGPSGAGKSTFLSSLFGDKQESAYGMTKVTWFEDSNHCKPIDSLVKQRTIRIAFLPQHDHLLNHLSVHETLMFASKIKNATRLDEMRLSSEQRKRFHKQNVRRVAKMLKLTECLQTRCGRLSGGQYKRVSIGQELLSEPDVIILDEPTSGLDAMTCLATVRTLRSIAVQQPISIILTIHQPDIDVFNLFDHVYVIAQGGRAIYEGPPSGVVGTLARANLHMPSDSYNPARFIVENAFIAPPESCENAVGTVATNVANEQCSGRLPGAHVSFSSDEEDEEEEDHDHDDDDDDDDVEEDEDEVFLETNENFDVLTSDQVGQLHCGNSKNEKDKGTNVLRKSLLSLTDALKSSKESLSLRQTFVNMSPIGQRGQLRESGKKPLLNFGGVKTFDGKLITSNQLGLTPVGGGGDMPADKSSSGKRDIGNKSLWHGINEHEFEERANLLKQLNEIQKAKYYAIPNHGALQNHCKSHPSTSAPDTTASQASGCHSSSGGGSGSSAHSVSDSSSEISLHVVAGAEDEQQPAERQALSVVVPVSAIEIVRESRQAANSDDDVRNFIVDLSNAQMSRETDNKSARNHAGDTTASARNMSAKTSGVGSTVSYANSTTTTCAGNSNSLRTTSGMSMLSGISGVGTTGIKLKRHFDKRLSAKHNNSKQRDYPIYYHSYLLTHRTWLSIVRDPIFFGIQFCMHTTIPILLALIFGSQQEEGCPRLGQFDLVDFAYQPDSNEFIKATMHAIRQSIGNIGVIFFEMFVLCFAINCITALVFPIDMYVLLKEYRNGWYSLRSYFIGRTLADLPVPIVLHSMAMSILYYMTGQPNEWWRFGAIIVIVIIASLVAQSVGLTIGALLMQSSQSAVLAAAGIVAPFFALSGFIVRIHTLPWVAQWAAQGSYLYHLLNGFIVMRYGFGRCICDDADFGENNNHQIPQNLRTMASIWIGTYSNDYPNNPQLVNETRTNVDPNIDLVDKLTGAFKLANSYGHKVDSCDDVLPYAMLDFNLSDWDIWSSFMALLIMLIVTRLITFSAIYYKIRSFA